MKRPAVGFGLDELTECANAAGYATVAAWVTTMFEVLEDFYELDLDGSYEYVRDDGTLEPSKAITNMTEHDRRWRLKRLVRGI